MMAKATEPFIFESWASENELPVKIIDVLNKEDINSEKILLGLSNEDIKGLGLSLGHKTLLKNAIAIINRTNTMGGTRAMTNQYLRKDAKLQEVVDSLPNSGAFLDNGLLSNLQDQTSATTSIKGKALFIPEFLLYTHVILQ